MLELNLISHSDPAFTGERHLNKNLIYIGSDYTCDIFTPGDEIKSIHFFIEIIGPKLLLHLGQNVPYIHIDGKRTTSVRYIRPGQQIKFASYELTVSNFLECTYPTARESINLLTDQLIQEGGADLEILKLLQNYE